LTTFLEILPMTNPFPLRWRLPKRLVVRQSINGLMLGLIGALAIGSAWLDGRASRSSRALGANEPPGTGISVGTRVIDLWLPQTLIELAVHQPEPWRRRVQTELRNSLDRGGQNRLWYALTMRSLQANGAAVEITFIRRPCPTDAESFAEFLDVVATAAGNPPEKYADAAVRILPGNLPAPQARQIVEQLVWGQ
jgi:hypothetical protein